MAVIGAGAAGLAAARELAEEGHDVVVFEQGGDVGGVWVYDPRTETDRLGTDPGRVRVHSSVYASLRTNLPREVMGYAAFPFTGVHADDARRFCGHAEVRAYLAAFADHYGLRDVVRLDTEVVSVRPVDAAGVGQGGTNDGGRASAAAAGIRTGEGADAAGTDRAAWGPRWRVISAPAGAGEGARAAGRDEREEIYDAVVVCNGHYSEPRVPTFPGSDAWPGVQVHSHNYREPSEYAGKKVVILGAMASGEDLSREIAEVAAEVHLAARGYVPPPPEKKGAMGCPSSDPANQTRRGGIVSLDPATSGVRFEDGTVVEGVDVVMYATGYHYTFPFLDTEDGRGGSTGGPEGGTGGPKGAMTVSTEDNCVSPLYEHVFPPALAPSLSFVGLPWKVVPFPQFELQSRWIARVLSGAAADVASDVASDVAWGGLPSRPSMALAAATFEASLATNAIPRRHAHQMGESQFAYNDSLSAKCGEPPLPAWRAEMYRATGLRKRAMPTAYRDGPLPWSDESAREDAREEARAGGFAVALAADEAVERV